MSKPYSLAPRARKDIRELLNFISLNNASAAERVKDALLRTFELVSRNESLGRPYAGLPDNILLLRALAPAKSYVIFFRRSSNTTRIVAVLHGSRDWANLI
jgi:Plasmid stabilization system protein